MPDFGLTWFDFGALAILALSGVMAFARGLIREVFSVIAFVAAGFAAIALSNLLAPFMSQVTGLSSALAPLAAGLAIFLGVFIVITVITSTLAKTAHQSTEIGSFDRAAGLAFGVLRGVLVVALPLVLLRQGPDGPETIRPPADPVQCRAAFDELRAPIFCARSYPIYGVTAAVLERLIPIIGQRFGDTIERRRGESATIPPAEAGSAQSPASGAPAQQK